MSLILKSTNSPITSIVFDFDNTLYFADEAKEALIWQKARQKLVNRLIIKNHLSPNVFNQLLQQLIDTALQIGWRPAYTQLGGDNQDYIDIIHHVSKMDFVNFDPKLQSLIKQLSLHAKLHIFTASSHHTVSDALKIILGEADSYFADTILAADDMQQAQKPDPLAYKEMITTFQLNPINTLYIDDQLSEIKTATACSFNTLLLDQRQQYSSQTEYSSLSSLHQLIDYIEII